MASFNFYTTPAELVPERASSLFADVQSAYAIYSDIQSKSVESLESERTRAYQSLTDIVNDTNFVSLCGKIVELFNKYPNSNVWGVGASEAVFAIRRLANAVVNTESTRISTSISLHNKHLSDARRVYNDALQSFNDYCSSNECLLDYLSARIDNPTPSSEPLFTTPYEAIPEPATPVTSVFTTKSKAPKSKAPKSKPAPVNADGYIVLDGNLN